ncbi:MAG: DUF2844 domain-containing protein [Oryzomonas sp.]|uniref:DUF2844 domain-containing protein n=1 Tax=Oryzomonas sp. TaxID=2855186 RepID=UPI00283F8755|nr:DUF2844 domain-containing protein [Oryzomonas sp.]MDR3579195.1 DUF2844 domain-containing protein [Oryzomonas sp.]
MKVKVCVVSAGLGLMAAALGVVQQAWATLGGSADSVATDRKALSAVQRATTVKPGYTVQEIISDATHVREYVSLEGIVFAIAWNGFMPPDLTKLLGSYAAEYQQALQNTPRQTGVRHQHVQGKRVIVEKWGHMRNLQGRAYVPVLVPSGVSLDDIK